ncbi:MAG: agmatinase family protein [Thermodesulfobacteriota bacterium]
MACLYGDTPPLFGSRVVRTEEELKGLDAVVLGVPWEGTITWGGWSGCELGPKLMREVSQRLTGLLPEYGLDVWRHIELGDFGDCAVTSQDVRATFADVERRVGAILAAGAIPIILGGDHSVPIPVVQALARHHSGKRIGVIQYDAHYDNKESHDGERLARNTPMRRIAETPGVRPDRIVQIGIRGPRNFPWGPAFARESGATVFTTLDIRKRGIEAVTQEAINIAHDGTDLVYVTVDSDIMDMAFNPGGPPDPGGVSSLEMLISLFQVGQAGQVGGLDVVEIYPPRDHANFSAHVMDWALLYFLGGLAKGRIEGNTLKE